MNRRAIVLLSGGIDSATTLAIALNEGYRCIALSFRYGQRHAVELEAARRIAADFGIEDHRIVEIDLTAFGGSALTGALEVPKGRSPEEMGGTIPITYVPARNIIFLSFALALAETTETQDIFIGVNALDYSGYPDCRPTFINRFEAMARAGTKAGIEGNPFKIHTPLIEMTKAEIIRRGAALGVDFAHTHSCYDPDEQGRACGLCDSCLLRKKGFHEADIPDPTLYKSAEA